VRPRGVRLRPGCANRPWHGLPRAVGGRRVSVRLRRRPLLQLARRRGFRRLVQRADHAGRADDVPLQAAAVAAAPHARDAVLVDEVDHPAGVGDAGPNRGGAEASGDYYGGD